MENQEYIKRIMDNLGRCDLCACLIPPSEDLRYILGFSPMYCERFQGLFICRNGRMFYVCNELYVQEIRQAAPSLDIYSWHDNDGYHDMLERVLAKERLKGGKLAFAYSARAFDAIEIQSAHDIRLVNGKEFLESVRCRKTAQEIRALKKSAAVIDAVMEKALEHLHAGMLEKDLLDIVKAEILARGAKPGGGGTPEGYAGIVCAGVNGANPHYCACSSEIKFGDAVVIDINCSVDGMGSDITRTVFVGSANARQRSIYEIVLEANIAGEQAAVCGAYIPDVDKAARDIIHANGFDDHSFPYRLGHGIGSMLHEAPEIKKCNRTHLESGMAFSIEPGIYLPGEFGVRIEDVVLIDEDGQTVVLNKVGKELLIV